MLAFLLIGQSMISMHTLGRFELRQPRAVRITLDCSYVDTTGTPQIGLAEPWRLQRPCTVLAFSTWLAVLALSRNL